METKFLRFLTLYDSISEDTNALGSADVDIACFDVLQPETCPNEVCALNTSDTTVPNRNEDGPRTNEAAP